ncbi:metallophosphoesterase family protein [Brevibacillus sp. H7]|uniref:metallophosphoesterase family protein n=1 Tax=Brevibacillus sp. H7 TaxID=3349138 RepID=UPI0038051C0D
MKTYLVSDIHGQYQAFMQALAQVGFSPENGDRLYVLGDIVDRGPQSSECLYYLYQLQPTYPQQVAVLKGNHEQMLEDWLLGKPEGDLYLFNGGDATIRSLLGNQPLRRAFLSTTPSTADQEAARKHILSRHPFLLGYIQSLPLYREELPDNLTGAPHAIFVHAGLRPGRSLLQQYPADLLWIRDEFYNHYNGETMVVFGHTPVTLLPGYTGEGLWRRGQMVGIDGGAAFWRGLLLTEWPSLHTHYVPIKSAQAIPTVRLFPLNPYSAI